MRHVLLALTVVLVIFIIIHNRLDLREKQDCAPTKKDNREICGTVNRGETFSDIFKKYGLDMRDLFQLREASASVHRLRNLYPGQPYTIVVDDNNQVESFLYWIDADNLLHITRGESGFEAQKVPVEYEKRIEYLGGTIKDNLITSLGEDREKVKVALQLSDVFAWDIDFTSDLREDDSYRILVEGHYLNGERRVNDVVKFAEPQWIVPPPAEIAPHRVLIVDEICDSGETLLRVREKCLALGASQVKSAVLYSHTKAVSVPDYIGIITDELLLNPWDREVLRDGKFHFTPEYVEALAHQGIEATSDLLIPARIFQLAKE